MDIPDDFEESLDAYVTLPPDSLNKRPNESPLDLSLDRKRNTQQQFKISHKITLYQLSDLVTKLRGYLEPISGNIDVLVYFKMRPTVLFKTYLRNFTRKERARLQEATLESFSKALSQTVNLVIRILKGVATFGESVEEHSLDLKTLNVESEFQNLLKCPRLKQYGSDGLTGMKCMLKLMQFESRYFNPIITALNQYHLQKCMLDHDFLKLQEIVLGVRNQEIFHHLSYAEAEQQWCQVETILNVQDAGIECLQLFEKMADSVEFYQFLKEEKFVGPNSAEIFRKQLDLISQRLPPDTIDHDMIVMNHLYASISFVAPFLDPHQTFDALMSAVTSLDIKTGLVQLDTVNSQMHLIRFWFSKVQVHTCGIKLLNK